MIVFLDKDLWNVLNSFLAPYNSFQSNANCELNHISNTLTACLLLHIRSDNLLKYPQVPSKYFSFSFLRIWIFKQFRSSKYLIFEVKLKLNCLTNLILWKEIPMKKDKEEEIIFLFKVRCEIFEWRSRFANIIYSFMLTIFGYFF